MNYNDFDFKRIFDIDCIVNAPEEMTKRFLTKGVTVDCTAIASLYKKILSARAERDNLRSQRKSISKAFSVAVKNGNVDEVRKKATDISESLTNLEDEVKKMEEDLRNILITLPNPPATGVVAGGKEANQVIRTFGKKPKFTFTPKDHIQLSKDLQLVDYDRARKIADEGFAIYTGKGAMLEWALLQFFYDTHYQDGYTPLVLPVMLNEMCGFTTGQFPKFENEVYRIDARHFLNPTAETGIINYHRDEILDSNELPKKYYAYTPCFRVEAGSSRKEERGMIRTHQFNKVEMIQFAHPDHSDESLAEMMRKAEYLVQSLGLHYQVSKLAAEDCSYSMATTYDIEVWIPSMGIYKEVSSVSNAFDYQARRGNIRFTDEYGKKRFVHTLNASGLATSRIFPAILEQYQQADGTIKVPDVLKKYLPFEYIA